MTSERLGEMFKGDSADTCTGKFPLVSMGGRADTSSVRRRGARTPIGASEKFYPLGHWYSSYILDECSYILNECSYILDECSHILDECSYLLEYCSYIRIVNISWRCTVISLVSVAISWRIAVISWRSTVICSRIVVISWVS